MSRALAALRSRGLLAGLTHEHATSVLDAAVAKHQANPSSVKAVGVYCGFDPTASSLHVGNLVTVMALRHFQLAGVKPILLVVGGATGMIGDPSMRSDERVMLTADAVAANARHLVDSLKNVLDFDCPKVGAEVANNMTWHGHMSVIDWMRECGAFARVNAMLARDSVKRRLDAESGLSFLEFSYQLFQAFDFVHLRRHHNVLVQVGGSDQWGNIVSGCDLVRKTDGHEVYGVTVPLLTTANGDKFGKSAGNAIWLDAAKTSVRYRRRLTDVWCQHATRMIHGEVALKAAQVAAKNINTAISVTLFVVAEGRRLIKAGGVYINNVRVDSDAAVIEASQVIEGRAVLVRVGKRNYHVLHISDAV
ncbi:hypothetical protein DYB37_006483 [Aphanomyces astaci]|uniref:Tyrosine--tRNA ligase n=1 Tax=Aphanomyces astaci TaxID=112090 RepID=A0A3R7A2U7_APHAT|nr:hypothetical protein DYB35_004533 [Aphanomyces astaci]RHZ07893.1 hypothetical protein DYB37_006483 [Aphanomyces astaci]